MNYKELIEIMNGIKDVYEKIKKFHQTSKRTLFLVEIRLKFKLYTILVILVFNITLTLAMLWILLKLLGIVKN
ncbi:MAG: hypothetical protein ACO2O6_00135 [Candidatus Hydrothermia bacterium]|jgi:hypothetical protein|nr:hypothetical protein [Candidatus Hydrothermia bacterium]